MGFADPNACITKRYSPFKQGVQHGMTQRDLCLAHGKPVFRQQVAKNVICQGVRLFMRCFFFYTASLPICLPLAKLMRAETCSLRRTVTSRQYRFIFLVWFSVPYLARPARTRQAG
ncbi:MAG: hypothetical protein ACLSWY_14455 [Ruthenibacterium lactatiformans]